MILCIFTQKEQVLVSSVLKCSLDRFEIVNLFDFKEIHFSE